MLPCKKSDTNIISLLESGFYKWGLFVAHHPWTIIMSSILLTGLCSIGFLNLSFESDGSKMWGPEGSPYVANNRWLKENFPQNERIQTILFQSKQNDGNILSPESLRYMYSIHKSIIKLNPEGISFQDICKQ